MNWINAGFLFGFLALAVPILIHLIHSRRYRPAPLGTLRFVLEALREQRRRRKLRDLLLLLARLCIVALLVFLFSRPFLIDPAEAEKEDPETLILLDASGSMDAGRLGTRNYELGWAEVSRVTAKLPGEARYRLALFSDRVAEATEATEARPAGGPSRYAEALTWAADRHREDPGERRVVLITDLQESGLPAEPLDSFPLDLPVEIVALPEAGDWNGAVVDVRPDDEFYSPESELLVEVSFAGRVRDETRQLSIEIEGERITALVPPRSGVVRVPWQPGRPGVFRGKAQLEGGDAWPRDNLRPFAFVLQPVVPVLLVDGAPGDSPFQQETYYLETALRVGPREGRRSPFRVERRTTVGDLSGAGIVALCNVSSLFKNDIDALRKHLAGGGGLIYFLGDQVQERAYRDLLEAGLFPAELEHLDAPLVRPVLEWDTEHMALVVFRGQTGALSHIRFREAWRVRPAGETAVLARQSDGSPAVLAGRHGRGRIVIVANPCDRDWSDWPQERGYLPVVRELFRFADQTERDETRITRVTRGIDESRAPGIYGRGAITVVTSHPDEGNPLACDEETFRARLGIGAAPAPMETEPETPPPAGSERKSEIWPWLALALLGLLLAENLLADGGKP